MQGEPTAYRIVDPGIRSLFTEASRFQAWLDVEAALAQAQAELGIIPQPAAEEITRKAQLSCLDMDAIRSGLARTGHPLVPAYYVMLYGLIGLVVMATMRETNARTLDE